VADTRFSEFLLIQSLRERFTATDVVAMYIVTNIVLELAHLAWAIFTAFAFRPLTGGRPFLHLDQVLILSERV